MERLITTNVGLVANFFKYCRIWLDTLTNGTYSIIGERGSTWGRYDHGIPGNFLACPCVKTAMSLGSFIGWLSINLTVMNGPAEGKNFGQSRESLSVTIKQILDRYPDGQISKSIYSYLLKQWFR